MDRLSRARERMLRKELRGRGIHDARVLSAMDRVPREEFVDPRHRSHAYDDKAMPIACGQTISQPYVVAYMVQGLELVATDRVLEVGCGSGYAAAVLSLLAAEVYTVERIEELAHGAQAALTRLNFGNVHVRAGDGTLGWSEEAPFDAILVSASGPHVPQSLLAQLVVGGRLVMPVEDDSGDQQLVRLRQTSKTTSERSKLGAVRFVPLVGREGW